MSCSEEPELPVVSLSPEEVDGQLNSNWDLFSQYINSTPDSALIYMLKVRDIAERYDKSTWVASAYWALGDINLKMNNLSGAAYNYLNAATLFDQLNKPVKVADAYNSIGDIYAKAKDFNEALVYFNRAKEIYNKAGSSIDKTIIYRNLAVCYRELSDFTTAEKMLSIAMEAASIENDYSIISIIHNLQGAVDIQESDFTGARKHYKLVLQYADSLPDNKRLRAGAINNIGEVHLKEGNYELASQYFEQALEIKHEIQDPYFSLSTINLMGKLQIEKGNFKKAVSLIEEGLQDVDNEINKEVEIGLSLMTEALVKAASSPDKNEQQYLIDKFAATSKSLVNYNNQLVSLRHRLESIGKKQAVQLAMEVHKRDVQIEKVAENNQQIKLAFIVPVLFLIAAIVSIILAVKRNRRYEDLISKIDDVVNRRRF